MKVHRPNWLILAGAVASLLNGCATNSTNPNRGAETAGQGKGHWVYLEPTTGSNVRRRIWIDENGNGTDPGSQVRTASPESFGRMQGTVSGSTGSGR